MFNADFHLKSVLDINKEFVEKNDVRALILDMDNTLSLHGEPAEEEGVMEWLNEMRRLDVRMMVVSNNNVKRVAPLAKKLRLKFTANGLKPLTFGVERALKKMGRGRKYTLVVGDQIFTDILAGNLAGMRTVLVEPFQMENIWYIKMKRKIEEKLFHRDFFDKLPYK